MGGTCTRQHCARNDCVRRVDADPCSVCILDDQEEIPTAARALLDEDSSDLLVHRTRLIELMEFPMWVIDVESLVELEELVPHESMRHLGLLKIAEPCDRVIFVSHQWLTQAHPDPWMKQFSVLQDTFRQLLKNAPRRGRDSAKHAFERRDEMSVFDSFVWYDYFAIPQITRPTGRKMPPSYYHYNNHKDCHQLQCAIRSLPTFVAFSDVFFVLAPTVHMFGYEFSEVITSDYFSWSLRGWCRAEVFTRLHSPKNNIVVLRSREYRHYLPNWRMHLMFPGMGQFSCCSASHIVEGEAIVCDKNIVRHIVNSTWTSQVQMCRDLGDWFQYRFNRACTRMVTDGWAQESSGQSDEQLSTSVADFLQVYRFQDLHDNEDGWTPLRYAAMEGNEPVVKAMICAMADVLDTLKCTSSDGMHIEGASILHSAMVCCRGSSTLGVLSALLDGKADPHADGDGLLSVPQRAIACGNIAAAHIWLDLFPDWDLDQPACGEMGGSTLLAECLRVYDMYEGMQSLTRRLLQMGARTLYTRIPSLGPLPMHCLGICQDPSILDLFVEFQIDLDCNAPIPAEAASENLAPNMLNALAASAFGVSSCEGMRPLCAAAAEGKLLLIQWLLTHQADPEKNDSSGMTPLKLSEKRGFKDVADWLRGSANILDTSPQAIVTCVKILEHADI